MEPPRVVVGSCAVDLACFVCVRRVLDRRPLWTLHTHSYQWGGRPFPWVFRHFVVLVWTAWRIRMASVTVRVVSEACDLAFFCNGDLQPETTLNNGYLGSRIDEERSELRYVV